MHPWEIHDTGIQVIGEEHEQGTTTTSGTIITGYHENQTHDKRNTHLVVSQDKYTRFVNKFYDLYVNIYDL